MLGTNTDIYMTKKLKGCLNKTCYCTGECQRTEEENKKYKEFQFIYYEAFKEAHKQETERMKKFEEWLNSERIDVERTRSED